jgi:2-polyprenyl-6-methoxyphenol hydroxylase-like FAD-dependent oxidoreductase
VLVVDPVPYGRDTLSTHALMRGAVLHLHRWGILDTVRASGAPAIGATTFHYGDDVIEVPIKARDGVDALYAPRRTVLDPILVDAAREAGAEVVYGRSLVDLIRGPDGRVRGARISGPDRDVTDVAADLVIGADGMRSRVARILGLEPTYTAPDAACAVYGYWQGVPIRGYHWFFEPGVSIGTIPTNDDATCVFVLFPQASFEARKTAGIDGLFERGLQAISPELAAGVARSERVEKLRGFAGAPGFLRPATGPGWALVGDAAYFRDPITAHGITDALREAELLARAISGGERDLEDYGPERDRRVRGLLDVTHEIAAFGWDLEDAKRQHLQLSREMNAQVDAVLDLG